MIIDTVVVVAAQHQLCIGAIDGPDIALEDVVNRLPGEEFLEALSGCELIIHRYRDHYYA